MKIPHDEYVIDIPPVPLMASWERHPAIPPMVATRVSLRGLRGPVEATLLLTEDEAAAHEAAGTGVRVSSDAA